MIDLGRVHTHSLVDDLRWALNTVWRLCGLDTGPGPGVKTSEAGREARTPRPPAGWP